MFGTGIAFICIGGYAMIDKESLSNINFGNFSIENVKELFKKTIETISKVTNFIANSSFDFINKNIPLIICLFGLSMIIYYIYRKIIINNTAREIYKKIKEELVKIKIDYPNDFEKGITVKDIINKYSNHYDYSRERFVNEILPNVITIRKSDNIIKSFIRHANGKYRETWKIK